MQEPRALVFVALAALGAVVAGWMPAVLAGAAGAALTLAIFARFAARNPWPGASDERDPDDRLWAGALAAATTFLLFAFF